MMLSLKAWNGVAARSSFMRKMPTRSIKASSLGSRSHRCAMAPSASNRTLLPWTLEDRPAMGIPLYPYGARAHTVLVRLTEKLIVKPGTKVRIKSLATDATPGLKGKPDVETLLRKNAEKMAALQYLMYAENKRSLLV